MRKRKEFIPNLNTFSALIDRLIIENIKLVNFENKLLDIKEERLKADPKVFEEKCSTQKKIIALLREELVALLENVLTSKKYDFLPERRTFDH